MEIKVKTQTEPADQLLAMMLIPAKCTYLKRSTGNRPRVKIEEKKKPAVKRVHP